MLAPNRWRCQSKIEAPSANLLATPSIRHRLARPILLPPRLTRYLMYELRFIPIIVLLSDKVHPVFGT